MRSWLYHLGGNAQAGTFCQGAGRSGLSPRDDNRDVRAALEAGPGVNLIF